MKRLLPHPWSTISAAFLLLAWAAPDQAQQPPYYPPAPPAPSLDGTWYNRANQGQCQIIQQDRHHALFINEHGSRAGARIEGDRVYIPDWQDANGRPLAGLIRGDRIIWPDGNYWYR